MENYGHKPVMLEEVLNYVPVANGLYVDGTLGLGGHTEAILQKFGGKIVGFDKDAKNQEQAKKRLLDYDVQYVRGGFETMGEVLEASSVDFVLLDLGISSTQVDEGERGFSFLREGKLDMRFDQTRDLSAEKVVNTYAEKELANIIWQYGEERFSRRIAKAIVSMRPLTTTLELAELIEKTLGRRGKTHPATKTFQALRIYVNDELGALERGLVGAVKVLKKSGRLAVISYHSLEDRIVKEFLRREAKDCLCPSDVWPCECGHRAQIKLLTKKGEVPLDAEIKANPRARSARLRVGERL